MPKYRGLTLPDVRQFFTRFVDQGSVPNIQESHEAFLVYMDCTYFYPPPSTVFINGEEIRQWHMSESAYWTAIRECNAEFNDACNYRPGATLTMTIGGNRRLYPANVAGLPSTNASTSFSIRMQILEPRTVTACLPRSEYHMYIRGVTVGRDEKSMPFFHATRMVSASLVEVVLKYDSPARVMDAVTDDFGRISIVTLIFSR